MLDHSDVQTAVDALADELGCPVLIEDFRHQPLWWSAQDSVDEVRMQSILRRTLNPESVELTRRLQLAKATRPVRTPDLPEIGMRERWCAPVRAGSDFFGFLWVVDGDGLVGEDLLAGLEACADVAAAFLRRTRSVSADQAREVSALVDVLVRGEDETAARELARLEHLPHDVRVVVSAPGRAGGWQLPGDLSGHAWTLTSLPATSGDPLPLSRLGEAARRADATWRAIRAGARLDEPTWRALGAWRLVIDAPDALAPSDIHPGCEVLAARSRPDLLRTARVVLDHGGDVAAASTDLHIHRTTLYYRLDRIHELIGVDLRDGTSRTDLQLALWLHAYRHAESSV